VTKNQRCTYTGIVGYVIKFKEALIFCIYENVHDALDETLQLAGHRSNFMRPITPLFTRGLGSRTLTFIATWTRLVLKVPWSAATSSIEMKLRKLCQNSNNPGGTYIIILSYHLLLEVTRMDHTLLSSPCCNLTWNFYEQYLKAWHQESWLFDEKCPCGVKQRHIGMKNYYISTAWSKNQYHLLNCKFDWILDFMVIASVFCSFSQESALYCKSGINYINSSSQNQYCNSS